MEGVIKEPIPAVLAVVRLAAALSLRGALLSPAVRHLLAIFLARHLTCAAQKAVELACQAQHASCQHPMQEFQCMTA